MAKDGKTHSFLMDCIANALIKLMKEKALADITIDELTQEAGVGRATYFRNFSSKQEVLTYKFIRHWEIETAKRNIKERNKFDLENAIDFFEINSMLKDVYDVVYAAGMQSTLLDAFYKIMIPSQKENTLERYREKFYSYGLFGLLDEWIVGGYKETPQQMAETLISICER